MIYEMKGICQHCASAYKILLVDSLLNSPCPDCGEDPIKVKKYKGLVYIVHIPKQDGVKVGFTTKDINVRLKELSHTGVSGKFEVIALFPSNKPKDDEKKAHDKLSKKYERYLEHFDTTPAIATQCVYRALNKRTPIFHCSEVEQQFYEELALNRIIMKRRLSGNSDDKGAR